MTAFTFHARRYILAVPRSSFVGSLIALHPFTKVLVLRLPYGATRRGRKIVKEHGGRTTAAEVLDALPKPKEYTRTEKQ
ncbi:MAG TPA: hypothetical protein VJN43_13655 [Bryobacteraceae bacterium]|nr:hypothetical protein [Bryobacteraceae bacterium]